MIWELSDGEDSAVETGADGFADATAETEVELCLPLEVDMELDQIYKEVPTFPGPADTDVVYPDPGVWCRFESPSGSDSGYREWPPGEQFPGAGRQTSGSGDGRRGR